MSELINGRTPEDLKDALMRCGRRHCKAESGDCPYYIDCLVGATRLKLMKDALAMIQRLEAERDAALAKVPKWIGMEEWLPTEKDATEEGLILCVLKNMDGSISKERRAWHWQNIVDMVDCFSHWMPLPEPPKEGE